MKESKFVTNVSSAPGQGAGGSNENKKAAPAPVKSGLDREHLVNAYGNVARGMKLPERKVKAGLCTKLCWLGMCWADKLTRSACKRLVRVRRAARARATHPAGARGVRRISCFG
jgi:hypothetical protein